MAGSGIMSVPKDIIYTGQLSPLNVALPYVSRKFARGTLNSQTTTLVAGNS